MTVSIHRPRPVCPTPLTAPTAARCACQRGGRVDLRLQAALATHTHRHGYLLGNIDEDPLESGRDECRCLVDAVRPHPALDDHGLDERRATGSSTIVPLTVEVTSLSIPRRSGPHILVDPNHNAHPHLGKEVMSV
ncbi:MAG: hypothetical protein ACRCYU_08250 [Nocardioides sp.]